MYDYLIVGAGLYGATFARVATDSGARCLVIEKRDYIGGNCADEMVDGIRMNKHGGHIFHTNSRRVWEFVNRFADWWPYRHKVIARNGKHVHSLPFNMATMYQIYGTATPAGARVAIRNWQNGHKPGNLEEWAISQLGEPMYRELVQGYTEKQWGRPCAELPASIIKRLPVRFTWNDDYYDDIYQGLPNNGYTWLVEEMLEGIEVKTGVDYFDDSSTLWNNCAWQTVYTGPVDRLFDYDSGVLTYRSLRWEHETHDGDYQGIATVNYTALEPSYTRIIEWKHFMKSPLTDNTIISKEYSQTWEHGMERYYPVTDSANKALAMEYQARAHEAGIFLGGRLGTYRYMDMDQVIAAAMTRAERVMA